MTGDGRADAIATEPNGTLWLYRNGGRDTTPYGTGAALTGVAKGDTRFPPYLYVVNAVTLDSPHEGTPATAACAAEMNSTAGATGFTVNSWNAHGRSLHTGDRAVTGDYPSWPYLTGFVDTDAPGPVDWAFNAARSWSLG